MAELTREQLYGRLAEVWEEIPASARGPLQDHLLGGTSAEWIAETLKEEGYPIGASTIRTWRRNTRKETA